MFYFVYILESQKDKGWYIGFTKNLNNRLKAHNDGKTISTNSRRPLNVIYFEAYLNREDALGREQFLKSGSGRRFLKKQLNSYLKLKQS